MTDTPRFPDPRSSVWLVIFVILGAALVLGAIEGDRVRNGCAEMGYRDAPHTGRCIVGDRLLKIYSLHALRKSR